MSVMVGPLQTSTAVARGAANGEETSMQGPLRPYRPRPAVRTVHFFRSTALRCTYMHICTSLDQFLPALYRNNMCYRLMYGALLNHVQALGSRVTLYVMYAVDSSPNGTSAPWPRSGYNIDLAAPAHSGYPLPHHYGATRSQGLPYLETKWAKCRRDGVADAALMRGKKLAPFLGHLCKAQFIPMRLKTPPSLINDPHLLAARPVAFRSNPIVSKPRPRQVAIQHWNHKLNLLQAALLERQLLGFPDLEDSEEEGTGGWSH
ncbi:hypothetical protein ACRALDRAFT_209014 [Sodiomyces alcalophilus JCM 7366]|uniref:uncharacterized protein n=1 Tax=Sodiomyces alcalophilus JCM 7366 TaxID=591952 RepID=UPI0039B46EDB